jgi:hypothetical protein
MIYNHLRLTRENAMSKSDVYLIHQNTKAAALEAAASSTRPVRSANAAVAAGNPSESRTVQAIA